jgi:hypothetical protein
MEELPSVTESFRACEDSDFSLVLFAPQLFAACYRRLPIENYPAFAVKAD